MPVFPRYVPRDLREENALLSSVPVLRVSDSAPYLATKIPDVRTKDVPILTEKLNLEAHSDEEDSDSCEEEDKDEEITYNTILANVVIPQVGVNISRILNHPHIISLVDIDQISIRAGSTTLAGDHADLSIWEDMNAGSLSYIVPSANSLPHWEDNKAWSLLSAQNYARFSLPEGLCWHVLRSISKALMWLHYGVKETEGVPGEYQKHDDDWHPILIMDVSPSQIWFKKPNGKKGLNYGECKLGGFQAARVTGMVGGRMAIAELVGNEPVFKQHYHAPEVYTKTYPWSRASEVWSLGAVIYTMMTGIPPARMFEHNWQISRMNDKAFSEYIIPIVSDMLKRDPKERPTTLDLVNRIEDQWRAWRANTEEGRQYFDKDDDKVMRAMATRGAGGLHRL